MTMPIDLAGQLKAATAAHHRSVERSAFMRVMLDGRLDRSTYCMYLRNLIPIYLALEASLNQRADHPSIKPVWNTRLSRVGALTADLNCLQSSLWEAEIDVLPSSESYASRIKRLCVLEPELLLAHVYVRYLGDLSGGQLLNDIVARSLGITKENGAGLAFYDFGSRADALELAQDLRTGLNLVSIDCVVAEKITSEAISAFTMHDALFEQLTLRSNFSNSKKPQLPPINFRISA